MATVRQMQGVSAHLEYLKPKDKRRHPSHCIFADGPGKSRKCTSPQSRVYMQHCSTAAKCDYYEEKN